MDRKIRFARNLVKGKIAETIFAQMLRETGKFSVLDFGYEKIIPELVQTDTIADDTLEIIRRAPDFAVINKETKEVRLIEVKYQKLLDARYLLKNAQRMMEAWNPSFIFLVTQDGFYFDNIKDIVERKGKITPLNHPFIPQDLQKKYLAILHDFYCEA